MDFTDIESSFPSWLLVISIAITTLFLLKSLIPKPKVDIRGRYVLITGCDSGFGRETAIRLDEMGVRVLATCLTKEGEQSLKSVTSERLSTFQMDVTNSQQIQDVFKNVNELVGGDKGLWGLVNNAGINNLLPIEWTPLDVYKSTADVNLWGMIEVTKTFLPLIKKVQGRVVNFSSEAGRLCINFFSSYCVTKYGVEAFSDALRREMYPWGIKVSILEPGGFKTKISDPQSIEKQITKGWSELSPELKEEYGEQFAKRGIRLFSKIAAGFSSDISLVVNAVVDALTSQSPRDRYLVGSGGLHGLFIWTSRLPASVADFLLRKVFRRLPVPAACTR